MLGMALEYLTGRQNHRNTDLVTSSMIPTRISHNSQTQASSDTSYINLVVRIGVDKCGYGGDGNVKVESFLR